MDSDNVKTNLEIGKVYGKRIIMGLYNGTTKYGTASVMVQYLFTGESAECDWLTCTEQTFKKAITN